MRVGLVCLASFIVSGCMGSTGQIPVVIPAQPQVTAPTPAPAASAPAASTATPAPTSPTAGLTEPQLTQAVRTLRAAMAFDASNTLRRIDDTALVGAATMEGHLYLPQTPTSGLMGTSKVTVNFKSDTMNGSAYSFKRYTLSGPIDANNNFIAKSVNGKSMGSWSGRLEIAGTLVDGVAKADIDGTLAHASSGVQNTYDMTLTGDLIQNDGKAAVFGNVEGVVAVESKGLTSQEFQSDGLFLVTVK